MKIIYNMPEFEMDIETGEPTNEKGEIDKNDSNIETPDVQPNLQEIVPEKSEEDAEVNIGHIEKELDRINHEEQEEHNREVEIERIKHEQ